MRAVRTFVKQHCGCLLGENGECVLCEQMNACCEEHCGCCDQVKDHIPCLKSVEDEDVTKLCEDVKGVYDECQDEKKNKKGKAPGKTLEQVVAVCKDHVLNMNKDDELGDINLSGAA